MHIFHNWSRWERYELKLFWVGTRGDRTQYGIEIREKRHCESCGKSRDRLVVRLEG